MLRAACSIRTTRCSSSRHRTGCSSTNCMHRFRPAPAAGAAASAWKRSFAIGSDNTQLVTFGDGDFEPAFGLFGGRDAASTRSSSPIRTARRSCRATRTWCLACRKRHDLPPGRRRWRRLRRSACARSRQACRGGARRRDLARGGAYALWLRRRDGEGAMNFELTEEQQQIRDTFARFCDERIIPQRRRDRRGARLSARAVPRGRRARLLRHALPRRESAASAST